MLINITNNDDGDDEDDDDDDETCDDVTAGEKPTCHVTPGGLRVREGELIEVGCSIRFAGSIAPNIDCRWSAGTRWETANSSNTNGTVFVKLSVAAVRSMEGQTVRCTTYFTNDTTEQSSSSRPHYYYTWTSSAVHMVTGNYFTVP